MNRQRFIFLVQIFEIVVKSLQLDLAPFLKTGKLDGVSFGLPVLVFIFNAFDVIIFQLFASAEKLFPLLRVKSLFVDCNARQLFL